MTHPRFIALAAIPFVLILLSSCAANAKIVVSPSVYSLDDLCVILQQDVGPKVAKDVTFYPDDSDNGSQDTAQVKECEVKPRNADDPLLQLSVANIGSMSQRLAIDEELSKSKGECPDGHSIPGTTMGADTESTLLCGAGDFWVATYYGKFGKSYLELRVSRPNTLGAISKGEAQSYADAVKDGLLDAAN